MAKLRPSQHLRKNAHIFCDSVNPNQIAYLRGKRYETEKKIQGAPIGNQNYKGQSSENRKFANQTNGNKQLTRDTVAKNCGVSGSTISDNFIFTQVVDILPEKSKREILSGKDKISRDDTRIILKMDKPTQKKFIKEVEYAPCLHLSKIG